MGSVPWRILGGSYEGLVRLGISPMATEEELMREVTIPFARRTDGTGVCFLYIKRASAEFFKFDQLPTPKDYGVPDPSGKYRLVNMSGKKGGANNLSLRVAYDWPSGRKAPYMARLRIGGDPCMDSVQVLTEHLNESGVEWLWFTKANGARLSRSSFHSSSLLRKGRACS